jgi:Protein of unknown function (DUF3016)
MARTRVTTIRILFAALAAAPALAWACVGADPVDVLFDHPEKFTDVKESSFPDERTRDYLLAQLRSHLRTEAPKRIPAGSCLAIVVTDVDMAGSFEPWRGAGASDIRVFRDVYPPRIDFAFRLTDDAGTLLKEGTRKLSDMNFLSVAGTNRRNPLDAEKRMLDAWLRREFTP